MDCPIVVTHGRLREWQIFTKRRDGIPNPETGAVTFDFTCYARAVVLSGVTTEPIVHEGEVELFFVLDGNGVVRVEQEEREIREGSSFAIPTGKEHRLINTGTKDLELILARRPPCADGSDDQFVVRYWMEDRDPSRWETPFQGHWNHVYRGPEAGIHIGDIPPHKISHPHNHIVGKDEIWYVRKGQGWHWMGREYHLQAAGWALWLDPEEIHSLMNPTDENVEYVYCASGKLLNERLRAAQEQTALEEVNRPNDPESLLKRLEQVFGALVEAYHRTGISIYGVNVNIPKVEEVMTGLKTALRGERW
jgi:mannose-6-phosphate isomerase-like protein (cupin superfamily)